MSDRTEVTPLLRRVVAALLDPLDPDEFGDGTYLDPEDLLPRVVGTVREAVVARAFPAGLGARGPYEATWTFDCALASAFLEDYRGELADLLGDLLRDALVGFATVSRVRAVVKEIPEQARVYLRVKVRGERREGA